jgi:hypothetical protein
MVDFLPEQKHDTSASNFTFGIYLGANNVYSINAKQIPGMNPYAILPMYGVYGNFRLNKKLSFEVGLGYIYYGAKYLKYGNSMLQNDTPVYFIHNVTEGGYVTVPLIVKYALSKKSSILGGIRFSGLTYSIEHFMGANINNQHQYTQIDTYVENDFDLLHNQLDVGLILGYEYQFSNHWSVSLMYNLGFIPIVDQSTQNQFNNSFGDFDFIKSGNNNNSFSIRLCYNFLFRGDNHG